MAKRGNNMSIGGIPGKTFKAKAVTVSDTEVTFVTAAGEDLDKYITAGHNYVVTVLPTPPEK